RTSTGPRSRSKAAICAASAATSSSNSDRRMSYAGLFQMNQGRLLLLWRPSRNSMSAGMCMGRAAQGRAAPQILAADIRHLDFRRSRGIRRADLRIVVRPLAPDRGDRIVDLAIVEATTDEGAQIVALVCKETGVEASVCREPRARAITAEGLRDRGDDAD